MPGGDGTGPLGLGALTGRGLGYCNPRNIRNVGRAGRVIGGVGLGLGLGLGLGYGCRRGRRYINGVNYIEDDYDAVENDKYTKTYLKNRKELLERQLKLVNESLNEYNNEEE